MNLLFALVRFFYNLLILNNNDDLNHELMPKIDKYRDVPRTLPNIYFEKKLFSQKILSLMFGKVANMSLNL